MMADRARATSARRRRDRHVRAFRRHEQLTVRMGLAAALHHSAQPAGACSGRADRGGPTRRTTRFGDRGDLLRRRALVSLRSQERSGWTQPLTHRAAQDAPPFEEEDEEKEEESRLPCTSSLPRSVSRCFLRCTRRLVSSGRRPPLHSAPGLVRQWSHVHAVSPGGPARTVRLEIWTSYEHLFPGSSLFWCLGRLWSKGLWIIGRGLRESMWVLSGYTHLRPSTRPMLHFTCFYVNVDEPVHLAPLVWCLCFPRGPRWMTSRKCFHSAPVLVDTRSRVRENCGISRLCLARQFIQRVRQPWRDSGPEVDSPRLRSTIVFSLGDYFRKLSVFLAYAWFDRVATSCASLRRLGDFHTFSA